MKLAIILYEPEIPPNTGNIIRLAANIGASLHLVEPLGFNLDEKQLRRAGMDYTELANVQVYKNLDDCYQQLQPRRVFALTTKSSLPYSQAQFANGDALLFGPESRGLPEAVRNALPEEQRITIPMQANCRSLNLSNAVAVVTYEAWRQLGFN